MPLCPNCGRPNAPTDAACPNCRWLPLQSTELVFVEPDESIGQCKNCGAEISVQGELCLACGKQSGLSEATTGPVSFRISTLLLLTTLIALCLALGRLNFVAGIFAFAVASAGVIRTAVLINERKRFGYPIAWLDISWLFFSSIMGLAVAGFIFAVGCGIGGMFIASIAHVMFFSRMEAVMVISAIALLFIHVIPAGILLGKESNRRQFTVGLGLAAASGIPMAVIDGFAEPELAPLLLLVPLTTLVLGSLCLVCRREYCGTIKSFVTGHSLALVLVCSFVLWISGGRSHDASWACVWMGFALWPLLVSIMILEQIWSWDDAFPHARTHRRAIRPNSRTTPQR